MANEQGPKINYQEQLAPYFVGNGDTTDLSRKEKHKFEALRKKISRVNPSAALITPISTILDSEDELPLLLREQQTYQRALRYDNMMLKGVKIHASTGVDADMIRQLILDPASTEGIISTMVKADYNQSQKFRDWRNEIWSFFTKNNTVYIDEDNNVLTELIDAGDIDPIDILTEHIRSRSEAASLIGMQIEWLREKNRQQRKAKKLEHQTIQKNKAASKHAVLKSEAVENAPSQPTLPTEPTEEEVFEDTVDESFALADWEIIWTKNYFSDNPNHLIPVPTQNRRLAAQAIGKLGRGQISVNPASIVNSLEFHLRRDRIQRALASRMIYGPEYIKDWVKLKRGDDRILLLIPDPEIPRAIFFAGNRNAVYKKVQ